MIMNSTNVRNIKSRCNQKLRDRVCGVVVAAMTLALTGNTTLAQNWIQLSPSGAPPTTRTLHSAVFDPGSNQMILFGGITPSARENDVWRLADANGVGTPTWTEVFPTGSIPATRWIHQAVYDEASNRMIVFGGGLGFSSPCTNEVWVLSNANGIEATPPAWTKLTPSGGLPAGRFAHLTVYDSLTNRLIIHGGSNCFTSPSYNDVWVLSNANGLGGTPAWTQLSPTNPPVNSFVVSPVAAYDPVSNSMIVFGGLRSAAPSSGLNRAVSNEVWVLSNANGLGGTPNWTKLIPTGTLPVPHFASAGVYDSDTNRMVIFGGTDASFITLNDVWELANANGLGGTPSWTELTPSGTLPSTRSGHSAVFDPVTHRMVIFGGSDSSNTFLNETWVLQDVLAPLDSDGDGVNDDDDACPDSDLCDTIVIGGVDTGVDNDLLGDGCSLADLIDAVLADNPSTAEVVQFLVALKKEGLIAGKDMGAILKALNSP